MVSNMDGGVPGHQGLADRIARWAGHQGRFDTAVPGLSLHRWNAPTEPTSYMNPPSICLIGQGRKRVLLGGNAYVYDAQHFLITSVDLPLVAQILEASGEQPYLALTLEIDLREVARLLLDNRPPATLRCDDRLGIAVSRLQPPLLGALERLLDLLDQPEDIPVLAPLVQREILYRLLVSEQGPRLRQMSSVEGHSYQIGQAIAWLKQNFDSTFRVEELAERAGMGTSTFHHHFRAMTTMSPLQYQKSLRLNQARQLMLMEHLDAATAAFRVGYESPSQFSREYSRLFGAPPMRDIRNLTRTTVSEWR